MTETNEINLTPNFAGIFDVMLGEMKRQGAARTIFADALPRRQELEALRAYQRFFAPLAVAAQAMTNRDAVERLRSALADMSGQLASYADEVERELAEDDADADSCDCADRSWYGEIHDTACPLAGKAR